MQTTLPGVEIVEACDLFIPGSYDAAFAGCVGVFHVAAVLGNSTNDQPNASGDGGKVPICIKNDEFCI